MYHLLAFLGQPARPGVCHRASLRVSGEGHLSREPGGYQAEGPGQVQVSSPPPPLST